MGFDMLIYFKKNTKPKRRLHETLQMENSTNYAGKRYCIV